MLFAKVTEPNAGYPHDKESVALLDPDSYYPVRSVEMGQSSTSFALKDTDGHYNSVNFTFYQNTGNGEMVEHDIYSDPKYNPYLSRVMMQKFD